MKRIKTLIITLAIVTSTIGGLAVISPATVAGAQSATKACNDGTFLGLPTWYRGLVDENTCEVKTPTGQDGLSNFIWHIVLNVIDMLLRIVGIVSVLFLIYGGFLFMTSQSSSDGVAKARKTIMNAIIGLVASMASVAIVNLILGGLLK